MSRLLAPPVAAISLAAALAPARLIAATAAALRSALLALALGTLALGLLFQVEVVSAVRVWSTSTAFTHCFLVVPIAAWLAWERRQAATGLAPRPLPWVALAALPLGLAWLAAERIGVMEGRQLAAMGLLQVLAFGVVGWRLWRAMAVPLLYLVFLVPSGAFLTPALQAFTARFIEVGLGLAGIPHYADALIIEIAAGTFYVAEACAGLRFLIAAIAFGVLYACVLYRSPWRRAGFIAASIVVPVVANGFRALGIVVLGHLQGSAEAAAVDHVLYGWLFFSIVLLLLILVGLPFREDAAPVPAPPPQAPRPGAPPGAAPRAAPGALLAVAFLVGLAGAGPAAALLLDRRAAAGGSDPALAEGFFRALDPGPGCVAAPAGDGPMAPRAAIRRFGCGTGMLTVMVRWFPPRAGAAVLVAAARAATGEDAAAEVEIAPLAVPDGGLSLWRLVTTTEPDHGTAIAVWIDGRPQGLGLASRLWLARASLLGGAQATVLVTVSAEPPVGRLAGKAIRVFLLAHPNLPEQARHLAAEAGARQ